MTLPERLKSMREGTGKTQKEMANFLGIAFRTWQNYEEGVHEPSWKVLEGLAGMGFNVNWLLTGEGEMKRGEAAACGWWAERFKKMRGNMSIPEFARKMNLLDLDKGIATIQAIEDSKIEADFGLMVVLSNELGISPMWMIDGTGHMLKADMSCDDINIEVLRDIIKEAEIHESINPGSLSSAKKSELIAELYKMRVSKVRE